MYLIDAVDLVLHRILDGDNLAARLVELAQHCCQRSCLAAASGPRDNQKAVGRLYGGLERRRITRVKPQIVDVGHFMGTTEKTQRHAFTVDRWHRCHADVKFTTLDQQPCPAILRQPPFGDIELAKDLDARNHGSAKFGSNGADIRQESVGAPTQVHASPRRLKVKIGRAGRRRLAEYFVHKINDGRFKRHVPEMLDFVIANFCPTGINRQTARLQLHAGLHAVNGRKNLIARRYLQFKFRQTKRNLKFSNRCQVFRIGGCYHPPSVSHPDRQHLPVPQETNRKISARRNIVHPQVFRNHRNCVVERNRRCESS